MRLTLFALIILATMTLCVPNAGVTDEPVPQPIVQETAEPSRGGSRILVMDATAYCYTGNCTYTGTWPQEGRTIAVDPGVISLNSEVYVTCESWPEVNGWYVAEDTGGAIKGYRIDVYMNHKQTCLEFGRRQIKIWVE